MKRNASILLSLCTFWFLSIAIISQPVIAEDVIKIGAAQNITGPLAFAGTKIHEGLWDYIKFTNEKGGVRGKKLEYIYEDSGNKVDESVAIFKRIMAKDNPLLYFGDSTGAGKALAPLIRERYNVFYGTASFSSELADPEKNPHIFIMGPTYSDMFGVILKHIAQAKPGAKVGFFYSDSEFGKDPIPFGMKLAKELGLEVVVDLIGKSGDIDMTPAVIELKRKKPDYLLLQGFVVSPIPALLKGCRDMGVKLIPMATVYGMAEMVLEQLGPLAEGYCGAMPYTYHWYDVPAIREMKAFSTKHNLGQRYQNNSYSQGWFSGMIFVECINRAIKAGKLDRDGLLEALKSIKNWDAGGLTAPVTYKNNKIPVAKIWRANVQKKVFEPVSDWIYVD